MLGPLLYLLAGLVALTLVGGWWLSAPAHRGTPTHTFDGRRFENAYPFRRPISLRVIPCLLRRDRGPWDAWREVPAFPPPPARVGPGELRVTLVNHACLLVQLDGLNMVTDPFWSRRCSPFWITGHRRRKPPGIELEALPPIDLVVVSHNHYDHLDPPSLRRLAAHRSPRFVVPLGNAALLGRHRISGIDELDWWQSLELGDGRRVHCVPAQHYSGRGLFDQRRALWAGFVLEAGEDRVFFAGDTGYSPHFADVAARLGPMRAALLPIGAYTPRWFMGPVHTSPEDAVRAHQDLGCGTSVAMHHSTFPLGDDAQDLPARELVRAREAAGLAAERFVVLENGEGLDVPGLPGPGSSAT